MTIMEKQVHREITPLKSDDCFLAFNRQKKVFNYPVHFHPEYEINFISNAKGGRRVVGDHIGIIDEQELVMIGPNIYHGWENYKNTGNTLLHEITIQFPRDFYSDKILEKNFFMPIHKLFQNANRGILFSKEITNLVKAKIILISQKNGFEGFLLLQSLLNDLANSSDQKLLTNVSFQDIKDFHNSERIELTYNYLMENYKNKIKVDDIAKLLNMTTISFSRLIKQRTGKTFTEFVNEIRIGFATRKLIDSDDNISQICYDCGFNNISNFNRIFKQHQNTTPSEFRINFAVSKNIS